MQKYKQGKTKIHSSASDKDHRIKRDPQLNMSQQCHATAAKANAMPGATKGIAPASLGKKLSFLVQR